MSWFSRKPEAAGPVKKLPVIDRGLCTGCGLCIAACPHGCIEFSWNLAELKQPGRCTSGGACAEACPDAYIEMKWVASAGERAVGEWKEGGAA